MAQDMKTAPPVILAPFMAVHCRQLRANRWGLHMKGRTVGRTRPVAQSHGGAPGGARLRLTAQGLHLKSPRSPTSTSADSRCRSDQCSHSVEFLGSPNNLEFDWPADKLTQNRRGSKVTLDSPEFLAAEAIRQCDVQKRQARGRNRAAGAPARRRLFRNGNMAADGWTGDIHHRP